MTRLRQLRWHLPWALCALGQPVCEHGAQQAIRSALGPTVDLGGLDLDLAGAIAWDLRGQRPEGDWSVATARARPSLQQIDVELDGLAATLAPTRSDPPPSPGPTAGEARSSPAVPRRSPVAIAIHGHGSIDVTLPHEATARLVDPTVFVPRDGAVRLESSAQLGHPHLPTPLDATITARREGRGWRGTVALAHPDAPDLAIELATAGGAVDVVARADDGGWLHLSTPTRGIDETTRSVELEAHAFPLASLGPAILRDRFPAALHTEAMVVDGRVELDAVRSATGLELRAHVASVVLAGATVEHPRLAQRPIRFAPIRIDGDLALTSDASASAQLVLGHGDAEVAIGGRLDDDALVLDAELAPLPCQALIAALPRGMDDTLHGARLTGEIAGHLALSLSFSDLRARRALEDPSALAEAAPPGSIALEFPFLERCRTLADPADIDTEGLRGPYRHRFLGAGRRHDRVLAPGAPGFVPLGRVPRIAAAFIALEDMRFWYHDGFDREQIARAFWHNLVRGGVRRGASTISQQTARNLWLGVDRSFARKLQEAYLTSRLEARVSKSRILELYLNIVELGPGVFGVEQAAQFYFGVPAEQLDALQAIHLAAMAPAPSRLSRRFAGGEVDAAWLDELRAHARRMYRNRMISQPELARALRGQLGLRDRG